MKATEILSEIRGVLGLELSEQTQEEVAVEFANAKLSNGTDIEAEAFEPGAAVFIVTEDEKVALPAGEYEMEDGKVLVVEEEGVISEMKDQSESEEETPAEEEVEAAEETTEASYVTKEEFASAINEIKEMIQEKMGSSEDLSEETPAEEIEVEAEQIEASAETPAEEVELAAEPITHNPEAETAKFNFAFQDNVRKDRNSRIKSILNKI